MNTTDNEEDKVQSGDEVIGNADRDGNKNERDTKKNPLDKVYKVYSSPRGNLMLRC